MTPKFLSLEFHTHFFPSLLWSRLQPRERVQRGFPSTLEFNVSLAICCILIILGIPSAVNNKSSIGWAVSGIGAAGIAVLLINSIVSHKEPPSYDCFLSGVFFFFVMLGLTSGIFVGTLDHSLSFGLLVGAGGLIAGYLIGILAGLWLQYLGWLALIVNLLAGLAVIGMFAMDLMLLSGFLS